MIRSGLFTSWVRFLRGFRIILYRSTCRLFGANLPQVPSRRYFYFNKITRRLFRFNEPRVFKISFRRSFSNLYISALLIRSLTFPTRDSTCLPRYRYHGFTCNVRFSNNGSRIFKNIILRSRPRTLSMIFNVSPITPNVRVTRVRLILRTLNSTNDHRYSFSYRRNFASTFTLIIRRCTICDGRTVTFTMILYGPGTVLFNCTVKTTKVRQNHFTLQRFLRFSRRLKDKNLMSTYLLFRARGTCNFRRTRNTCNVNFNNVFKRIRKCFSVTLNNGIVCFIQLRALSSASRETKIYRISVIRVGNAFLFRITCPLVRMRIFSTTNIREKETARSAIRFVSFLRRRFNGRQTILPNGTKSGNFLRGMYFLLLYLFKLRCSLFSAE